MPKTAFDEEPGDIPPLRFETGIEGREAELLSRFVWKRIMNLIECDKEIDANSLLQEFDLPPLWSDPEDGTPNVIDV